MIKKRDWIRVAVFLTASVWILGLNTAQAAEKNTAASAANRDFRVIEEYDVGKSRAGLAAIEETIRNTPVSEWPGVETGLLTVLASPQTSFAGRQFVCRMLRQVGSARCVPALEKMLGEKEMSHMARYALQKLAAPEAAGALRRALSKASDDLKIGIVDSLGQRGDQEAVVQIARLVEHENRLLSSAAINALGHIGGREAVRFLSGAKVARDLETLRQDAILRCADQLLRQGRILEAAQIYQPMTEANNNTWIRIAAYKGLIQARQDRAASYFIELLNSKDLALQRAAGKFIAEISGSAITSSLARELNNLDASGQVVLISALETRGDKIAAVSISQLADHPNEEVRSVALRSLAVLGDSSCVPLLARAAGGTGNTAAIAQTSLERISGDGIYEALAILIQGRSESGTRQAAIQAVIDRRETRMVPVLLKAATDSDSQVRTIAAKALGELAGPDQLASMVKLLVTSQSSADRGIFERAIASMIVRNGSIDPAPILSALASADGPVKIALLGLLSRVGDEASLAAVRSQMQDSNSEVKRAAIRAMAEWPDPAPLEDLFGLARTETDMVNQILALRGYISLLGLPANRGSAETVKLLGQAMAAARRVDEKRAVLAALPRYPCEEALKMAQDTANQPGLENEAKLAADKIKQALVNQSRKATASLNSSNAHLALDNNKSTRWDTGRTMKPGDWFVLDLGIEASVAGLTLDTTESANDFPRGYEVYVSFDGGNWGKPVVIGGDGEPVTKIRFEKPIRTRFLKIVQLGSSDNWYWSIHELTVDME
ncbi:MAG: HEAT repeat domain-containing protein [Sedimentisphaerales bacterium]|nr:HEAT repeat domain-containing protein [Sedimentisphaerales bacterium]